MRFFKLITDHLPQSVVNNMPSKEQAITAIQLGLGSGLWVGAQATAVAIMNDSSCSEEGYDNLAFAMTEAAFESVVLMLALSGLINVQNSFGIRPESMLVGGECVAALVGYLTLRNHAANTIPAVECYNSLNS